MHLPSKPPSSFHAQGDGSPNPEKSWAEGPFSKATLASLFTGLFSSGQLYVLSAALLVLANARLFYGSLMLQTEHVALWFSPHSFQDLVHGLKEPPWSAPLDDVFIHFDFARSWARGFPFEWSEGNGYSSGGTSLLYPIVLALGYLGGYRDLSLMHFAAIVATVSIFASLLGLRRMFSRLPEVYALLLPPLFLSVGGLNWSLYSGMEVAFFLAIWALCFVYWDDFRRQGLEARRQNAMSLGLALLALVASRPEAAPLVAVFAVSATWPWLARKEFKKGLLALSFIAGPAAGLVVTQIALNRVLTGSGTAAGGLAKLELYHPYFDGQQVFEAWIFFLRYQFERLSLHHFSALPGFGFVLWPLGLLSLAYRSTRRYGALLWSTLLIWTFIVALNGQVRWQNERYAMPTVAWLLTAVALGAAGSVHAYRTRLLKTPAPLFGVLVLTTLVVSHFVFQAERFRDQVWFFGRASRNILEQHIRTGTYLSHNLAPRPRRVLLSDAGAIPYASDLPAFDLIGLGGYAGLPIAEASRLGVGAAVELIERLPSEARPDVMALYPTWWGDFLLWFGKSLVTFPVRGNVICGGTNMVVYRPDFRPLDHSAEPFGIEPGERLVDALDVADLLSEKAHAYSLNHKSVGFVDMKMLADPRRPSEPLWDAGRVLTGDLTLSFQLRGFQSKESKALLVRVAPATATELELMVGDAAPQKLLVPGADRWQEVRLPFTSLTANPTFQLRVTRGGTLIFHIFAVEPSVP
jgi:hypothetical protein